MKYDPYCGANLSDGAVSFLLGLREGEPADAGRLNEGSNIEPVKKIYAVIGTMLLIIMLWSWQCVL